MDGLLPDEYSDDMKNIIYKQNLKYIRKSIQELENIGVYTDLDIDKIKMKDIWSRLSDLGFNYYEGDKEIVKNIQRATDKSMDEGVRNLVNAVYIACMI